MSFITRKIGEIMNKLFKTGQYVLLEDCEAYDDKYALLGGTTKRVIAEKMRGGSVNSNDPIMKIHRWDVCVGILREQVGVWCLDGAEGLFERISVEDVLYTSEDGLTLDELSEIPCAFDKGKEYTCVSIDPKSLCNVGQVYKSGNKGLIVGNFLCDRGYLAKFKLTTKSEVWIPSVGEEVIYTTTENQVGKPSIEVGQWYRGKIIAYYDGFVWTSDNGIRIMSKTKFKPIDKERESVIQGALEVLGHDYQDDSVVKIISSLYDVGILKSIKS